MDAAQYSGLIAVIGGGLGLVAAAIRYGLSRVAKSFDDMAHGFSNMGGKLAEVEKTLVRVEKVVEEGRDDISDAVERFAKGSGKRRTDPLLKRPVTEG